jgi:hypothetical protein
MILFMDAAGKIGLLRDFDFRDGGALSLPPTGTGNLPCSPARFLHVGDDGSVRIGSPDGRSVQQAQTGVFAPPIKILKLCLIVSGTYRRFGKDANVSPQMLQWPTAPEQPGWVVGPIANDNDQSKWIPQSATGVGMAFGLRRLTRPVMTGKTSDLLPDAVKCDVL